ncbi:carboxypeptidase-like regulatory domain-containing protein [Pseudomonas sp. FP1740]|uniref:carboxypeptidase-like regulatory domain-containing protein n=1 Tax=Pseudomonas sp. FP1740 TaxID=2954078 RepID=UPI002732C087|nr:carboxypeptidase-like regulatory domain-containing protein [Pseudomonas sp. FP1740]WLG43839.1 carboxypeptidase-like regulatory domain-containing protein [Pseudomonas sp. FP1740]
MSEDESKFSDVEGIENDEEHIEDGNHDVFMERSPLPVIDNKSTFTRLITGTGGGFSSLTMIKPNTGEIYSYTVWKAENRWSLLIRENVLPGRYTMQVEQVIENEPVRYSAEKNFLYLSYPKITKPRNNEVIKSSSEVEVSGNFGAPNQVIELRNEDKTKQLGSTAVDPDGNWRIKFNAEVQYPGGGLQTLHVRHIESGDEAWSTISMFLLAKPVITGPGGELQESPFALAGNRGNASSILKILIDPSLVQVGGTHSLGGSLWSEWATVEPGEVKLVVVQERAGVESERSIPRQFKIRPARVSNISATVNSPMVVFKGDGYLGASVKSEIANVNPHPTPVFVGASGWELPPVKMVPSGAPQVCSFLQSFRGIESLNVNHQIMVPTPVPTGALFSLNGNVPVFDGTSYYWPGYVATVTVYINGSEWESATVSTNATWRTPGRKELAPGSHTPRVRLLVNQQWSGYRDLSQLIVKPKAPDGIEVTADGFAPNIKGKCWPLATLSLKYSDETTLHPISGTAGGAWSTRRTKPFTPGNHTFTVTQTFGGQTSPATAEIKFNIATPKPVIKSPSPNSEANLRPTVIVSNVYLDAVIKIYDARIAGKVLGQHTVTKDEADKGECSILLAEEFAIEGSQTIKVEQEYKGQKSDPSADLSFNVRLSKPLVDQPQATKSIERFAEYSGTGWPKSNITLTRVGVPGWVKEVEVDSLGNWKVRVLVHEVGPQTLAITQQYKTFTRAGDDRHYVVRPNVAVLETPAKDERLASLRMFSGHGYPGDTVSVVKKDSPTDIFGTVEVSDQGTWSFRSEYTFPIGHDLQATLKQERDGYSSDPSYHTVHVLSAGPSIYEPASGDWGGIYPWVSGQDEPGAKITVASVFDALEVLAPVTTVDESGRWRVQLNKALPVGPNWVQTRASRPQPDGKADVLSDWVRSERFFVEKMSADFESPRVTLPLNNGEVGLEPVLRGLGLPGARISIVAAGPDAISATAWVDRFGRWTARFDKALPVGNGRTSYSIHQSRDGVLSSYLSPNRSFKVIQVPDGFPAPVIVGPEPDDGVDQRFWLRGTALPGARVNVYRNAGDLFATTEADAAGQWQVCSNRVLSVGDFIFKARQTRDGKESQWSSTITVKVSETVSRPMPDTPENLTQITPVTKVSGLGYPGATVTLHRTNDPNTSWGAGKVDEDGYWDILTEPLPLGLFKMTGKQVIDGKPQSDWMLERSFYVVDAG